MCVIGGTQGWRQLFVSRNVLWRLPRFKPHRFHGVPERVAWSRPGTTRIPRGDTRVDYGMSTLLMMLQATAAAPTSADAQAPATAPQAAAPAPQPAAPTTVQPGAPIPIALPKYGRGDLEALKDRGEELSSQIRSATSRRNDAVEELAKSPPGPARAGLEGRIAVLDERIMNLEMAIAENGRAKAEAQVSGISGSAVEPRFGPFTSKQLMGLSVISILAVWGPLAIAAATVMVRRWGKPKPAPQILESSARLERMEQAIDAVAIEVERISEGQRFVTQAMAKNAAAPALGVGQAPAEPIKVPDAERVAR